MKHELMLTEKQQAKLSDYMVKTLNSYCKCRAFENSEFLFPIALGLDDNNKLLIKNLPDLGNIFLFGDTGEADYYMGIVYIQLESVLHKFDFRMTVVDCAVMNELVLHSDIDPRYELITGKSFDFVDVLPRVEREAAFRRANPDQKHPHKIFFIYVSFLTIDKTTFEQLKRTLNDNLNTIGIQIIFCAADSRSTASILPLAEYFQTTIGGRTSGLHNYSTLSMRQFLMKCGDVVYFINSRYGEEISDPDDGKECEVEIPAPTQMQIARAYCMGENVEKDLNKAIAIYENEIKNGNARAAFWLAILYATQYRDYKKERFYYQRAAEMGDVEAQKRLKEIKQYTTCTLCGRQFDEYENAL